MCHPKGRSAAKDARSALTRRPARSYSAPTIPATVRHARRRSGELPAPLADPPIAPSTHPHPFEESLNKTKPFGGTNISGGMDFAQCRAPGLVC